MFKHFIVIGNAFNIGKRIALHYVDENFNIFSEYYASLTKEQKEKYVLSFHTVETNQNDFSSVKNKDAFFANLKVINDINEFFDILNKNNNITAYDVAKYIITSHAYCHTKIQKLVYMCYADYLIKYKKKLFDDSISAWNYGPVIPSLYKIMKKFIHAEIGTKKELKTNLKYANDDIVMKARIMSSEDGINKISSIDETLSKYKDYYPNDLVELTHNEDSPWSHTKQGDIITDDCILKYHCNEV